jgi:hypothetical protein
VMVTAAEAVGRRSRRRSRADRVARPPAQFDARCSDVDTFSGIPCWQNSGVFSGIDCHGANAGRIMSPKASPDRLEPRAVGDTLHGSPTTFSSRAVARARLRSRSPLVHIRIRVSNSMSRGAGEFRRKSAPSRARRDRRRWSRLPRGSWPILSRNIANLARATPASGDPRRPPFCACAASTVGPARSSINEVFRLARGLLCRGACCCRTDQRVGFPPIWPARLSCRAW